MGQWWAVPELGGVLKSAVCEAVLEAYLGTVPRWCKVEFMVELILLWLLRSESFFAIEVMLPLKCSRCVSNLLCSDGSGRAQN
jgi:hypothetical protein